MAWIEQNQAAKQFAAPLQEPLTFTPADPSGHDLLPYRHLTMPVLRPKVMVGLRGHLPAGTPLARLKSQVAISMMLELLFDDTGEHYQALYDQGIIDDSFSFSYESNRGFDFALFATETTQQAAFRGAIANLVENAPAELARVQAQFAMLKNATLGRLIGALDSPEAIVNRFATRETGSLTIYDEIRVLRALTWADIQQAAADFMDHDRLSVYEIDAEN